MDTGTCEVLRNARSKIETRCTKIKKYKNSSKIHFTIMLYVSDT